MPIELTGKIVPKNDAFVGIVNPENVSGSGYIPSAAISGVKQWQLKSGNVYWAAYASAQIALYSETYSSKSDLTNELDSEYQSSGNYKCGYYNITDGGTIPHGLGQIPSYVNIMPSGNNVNFGVSCVVDDTNITVSLTAPGSRDVFWNVIK